MPPRAWHRRPERSRSPRRCRGPAAREPLRTRNERTRALRTQRPRLAGSERPGHEQLQPAVADSGLAVERGLFDVDLDDEPVVAEADAEVLAEHPGRVRAQVGDAPVVVADVRLEELALA